jgi:hypothetical protein
VTFGSEGTRIAVLDGARVHFVRLALDDDHGSEAEVASGLDGSERIVNNPGQNLAEGIEVEVHAPADNGARSGNAQGDTKGGPKGSSARDGGTRAQEPAK